MYIYRILGFNRVPPLVGRVMNITRDIREKATDELGKTFFISPGSTFIFSYCRFFFT